MNATYKHQKQPRGTEASTPIHTTLYDLIDAIDTKVGSDASDVTTAAVIRALQTYRVSCLGDFAGYRMILDEEAASYSAVA